MTTVSNWFEPARRRKMCFNFAVTKQTIVNLIEVFEVNANLQ